MRKKLILVAVCCFLTGCAPARKQASVEELKAFCAKHENLPIYSQIGTIYIPTVKGLDQCSIETNDDFGKVNDWCVNTFTSGPWADWELTHDTSNHPKEEFYDLKNGERNIWVYLTGSKDKTVIQYVIPSDGAAWQSEHYAPVKRSTNADSDQKKTSK